MGARPVYRTAPPALPLCLHPGAVKVTSSFDRDLIYRCLCPDCDKPLPASFKRSCCGTPPGDLPGEGHRDNCAGKPPRKPQPPPYAPDLSLILPQPAAGRWRRYLPIAFPVLAAAVIAGACMAGHLKGPEAYNAADAQVCQTWAVQDPAVLAGQGNPGGTDGVYVKFTAAETTLTTELGGNVNPVLSGFVQQWDVDAESGYNPIHGDWGFLNTGSDRDAVTAWCKANKYTAP